MHGFFRAGQEGPSITEGEDNCAHPFFTQTRCRFLSAMDVSYLDARQESRLTLVGNQVIQLGQGFFREGLSRGWIQNDFDPFSMGYINGVRNDFQRALQLKHQDIRLNDSALGSVDVLLGQAHVGPWGQDDAVLTAGIQSDEGDASSGLRVYNHMGGINTQLAQVSQLGSPKVVVPHPADHGHLGSQPGSSDGLVGPLAPRYGTEVAANDSLTGDRHVGGTDHQVHVQTTNNGYLSSHYSLPGWHDPRTTNVVSNKWRRGGMVLSFIRSISI